MKEIKNYLLISIPSNGTNQGSQILVETNNHDFTHTQNVGHYGENLTAIANNLQALPPEFIVEIVDPLRDVIRSAGIALSKITY